MTEQAKLIAELGMLVVSSGLLLYIVYQSFTNIKPVLESVKADKELMNKLIEAYEKHTVLGNQALQSVADAHSHVSTAVESLEDTIRHQSTLTQLQYDTVGELQEKIDHLNGSIQKLDENLRDEKGEQK